MAAVLAGGRGALLSHRSAGTLWGILSTGRPRIEITLSCWRRSPPGIKLHQGSLGSDERILYREIPVTTVPRTLLDLAAVLDKSRLERAVNEAETRRLLDPLSLSDLVERHPRRRGTAGIKALLAAGRIGQGITRSELEHRFLGFVEDAGLPRPELNLPLQVGARWFEVDCLWRSERLIVELDGYAFHATRSAYERDRARDRALNANGWRVVRVTWGQLHGTPNALAADLRRLIAPARYPDRP